MMKFNKKDYKNCSLILKQIKVKTLNKNWSKGCTKIINFENLIILII